MGTGMRLPTAMLIRTPGAAGRVRGLRDLMLRTVGEEAAGTREHSRIVIRRRSAGGAATRMGPVADGVRGRRVRVAGVVVAAAADGAAEVVVALVAGGRGAFEP
jgi:hypothetical protein